MADAQKVIELIFQGVDKTGAATQSALDNAQKFSGSIKDITQPIADFTVGALKLEAGLLTAGAAIVAFSVKSASDFDSAFRQISTIIDASDEDLARFKESILSYASTSTQPLETITQALGNAIGSGVDYAQSLDLLATAEKLAVATRSELDGTTKVLVSTLNSYGLSIGDAQSVSDLFFKIIDEGDISMTDLANSFAKVAPIAKISGVSLEEVGAAIATLTASGIKPAESIEYLRGAISNIISPSKQGSDLAAELGIQFSAAGLKANGLAGVLEQVALKTGGSADQMKLLFGDIGGFTAAATLAGPQADKFRETIKAMGDVAGATDIAFAKMTSSLDSSAAKISSAFQVLSVRIGQPLLDEFGGIATAIAKVFEVLGVSVKEGALKDLVEYVESNLKDLQAVVETIAKNLPAALKQADFSGFQRGIDSVINAFKLLFNNIDLSTVEGLTRAIEVAGAAFLGLSKFTAGVIESFKPLFDLLVKTGSQATSINPEILEMAGNFAGFATQANILVSGLAGLLPMLEALVGLLIAKQGLSLVGGIQAVVAAAPALSAALGPLALGAAALYAGDQIVRLVKALADWKEATANVKRAQEDTNEITKVGSDVLADFAKNTGFAAESIEEAQALIDSGKVVWDDATERYVAAGQEMKKVADSASGTVNPLSEANQKMLDAYAASERAAGGASRLAGAQNEVASSTSGIRPIYDALTGAIVGYEQSAVKASATTDKAADSLKKTATEAEKAKNEAIKFAIELEKIASNERIKTIEAVVKLDVAQLEADTKRIEATFASIDNTVNSTGELIGDLFGILKDYDNLSFGAIRLIQDQLDLENKIRQEAFLLQKALTETQIEYMRAQLAAMRNGDGFIKIDGAGLQPHLEAFMWEILKTIQVRVNSDGLKLLLGV